MKRLQPYMTEQAQVGDIIMSSEFAKADKNSSGVIHVGTHHDGNAYNKKRADFQYLVTDAKMTGGGCGHGQHDIYPDGWYITAQRMKDGKHNPRGEKIHFYQSGCFNCMIAKVKVVGKLKKKVTITYE